MANLVDTSVNGDLRVTGTIFGTQAGNYATCATAAGTAAKAVTISGFTLTTGIHVFVKFTVTNTAAVASLTLNVSGTGAKAMKYRGGNLPAVGTLSASRVYEFIYDGTNWELVGDLDTNTQTVTGVKGNAESSYRTGQVNLTAANIGASTSDHTHGNIANGGTLQTNDITIANGDKLVVTDSSDSSKVARASIAFDGSTTTQALTKAGTWATFNNYSHPAGSAPSKTGVPTANATPGFGGTFKVNQITTDATSHVSAVTERTITIPNTTATTSAAGLMSAADKTKLDGITSDKVNYWDGKQDALTFDTTPTAGSTNPVTSNGIRTMKPISHRFDNENLSRLIVWGKANSKGYINDMVRKFGLKYGSVTDFLFTNSVHKDNTTSVNIKILNDSGIPTKSTMRLKASIFKDSSENSYFALWLDGSIPQPGSAYYVDYYPDVSEQYSTVSHFTVFNPSEYTLVRNLTIKYIALAVPSPSAGVLTSDGTSNSWSSVLPLEKGGTGASNASTARTNLSVPSKEDFESHTGNETVHITAAERTAWNAKQDKVSGATAGDVATLDANGNLVDSGKTLGKSVPANAVFTDTKVTQTKTDSDATAYPLLMAGAADPNGTATTARYDSGVKLTPSTNTISANISGNAATATSATKLGTSNVGTSTKPIYLAAGVPEAGSTYAGGTAVTLNGTSASGSTASFYAPTSTGTNRRLLRSNGSGAPTWQIPAADYVFYNQTWSGSGDTHTFWAFRLKGIDSSAFNNILLSFNTYFWNDLKSSSDLIWIGWSNNGNKGLTATAGRLRIKGNDGGATPLEYYIVKNKAGTAEACTVDLYIRSASAGNAYGSFYVNVLNSGNRDLDDIIEKKGTYNVDLPEGAIKIPYSGTIGSADTAYSVNATAGKSITSSGTNGSMEILNGALTSLSGGGGSCSIDGDGISFTQGVSGSSMTAGSIATSGTGSFTEGATAKGRPIDGSVTFVTASSIKWAANTTHLVVNRNTGLTTEIDLKNLTDGLVYWLHVPRDNIISFMNTNSAWTMYCYDSSFTINNYTRDSYYIRAHIRGSAHGGFSAAVIKSGSNVYVMMDY